MVTNTNVNSNLNMGVPFWIARNSALNAAEIADLSKRIGINIHKYVVTILQREKNDLGIELVDPIKLNLLTESDLNNYKSQLQTQKEIYKKLNIVEKRFIPKPIRQFIPGAIKWFQINYPNLRSLEIARALGKTKKYVDNIRISENHIEPINPVSVQLISNHYLNELLKNS